MSGEIAFSLRRVRLERGQGRESTDRHKQSPEGKKVDRHPDSRKTVEGKTVDRQSRERQSTDGQTVETGEWG